MVRLRNGRFFVTLVEKINKDQFHVRLRLKCIQQFNILRCGQLRDNEGRKSVRNTHWEFNKILNYLNALYRLSRKSY